MVLWFKNLETGKLTPGIYCTKTGYTINGHWQGRFIKKDNVNYFGFPPYFSKIEHCTESNNNLSDYIDILKDAQLTDKRCNYEDTVKFHKLLKKYVLLEYK